MAGSSTNDADSLSMSQLSHYMGGRGSNRKCPQRRRPESDRSMGLNQLTGSATLPFRSARITVEFSGPRAHASDCVKK